MMKPEHANYSAIQLLEELSNKRKEFASLSQKLLAINGKLILMKDGALLNSEKKEIKSIDFEILGTSYRCVKSGNEIKQFQINKDHSLKEVHADIVFEGLKQVNSLIKECEDICKLSIEEMFANYRNYSVTSTKLEERVNQNESNVSDLLTRALDLGTYFPLLQKKLTEQFKEGREMRQSGIDALNKSTSIVWSFGVFVSVGVASLIIYLILTR